MKKLLIAVIGILAMSLMSTNSFAFTAGAAKGIHATGTSAVKVCYGCCRSHCYSRTYAVAHTYYTYHRVVSCCHSCYRPVCYRPCCVRTCGCGGGWFFGLF